MSRTEQSWLRRCGTGRRPAVRGGQVTVYGLWPGAWGELPPLLVLSQCCVFPLVWFGFDFFPLTLNLTFLCSVPLELLTLKVALCGESSERFSVGVICLLSKATEVLRRWRCIPGRLRHWMVLGSFVFTLVSFSWCVFWWFFSPAMPELPWVLLMNGPVN